MLKALLVVSLAMYFSVTVKAVRPTCMGVCMPQWQQEQSCLDKHGCGYPAMGEECQGCLLSKACVDACRNCMMKKSCGETSCTDACST